MEQDQTMEMIFLLKVVHNPGTDKHKDKSDVFNLDFFACFNKITQETS